MDRLATFRAELGTFAPDRIHAAWGESTNEILTIESAVSWTQKERWARRSPEAPSWAREFYCSNMSAVDIIRGTLTAVPEALLRVQQEWDDLDERWRALAVRQVAAAATDATRKFNRGLWEFLWEHATDREVLEQVLQETLPTVKRWTATGAGEVRRNRLRAMVGTLIDSNPEGESLYGNLDASASEALKMHTIHHPRPGHMEDLLMSSSRRDVLAEFVEDMATGQSFDLHVLLGNPLVPFEVWGSIPGDRNLYAACARTLYDGPDCIRNAGLPPSLAVTAYVDTILPRVSTLLEAGQTWDRKVLRNLARTHRRMLGQPAGLPECWELSSKAIDLFRDLPDCLDVMTDAAKRTRAVRMLGVAAAPVTAHVLEEAFGDDVFAWSAASELLTEWKDASLGQVIETTAASVS